MDDDERTLLIETAYSLEFDGKAVADFFPEASYLNRALVRPEAVRRVLWRRDRFIDEIIATPSTRMADELSKYAAAAKTLLGLRTLSQEARAHLAKNHVDLAQIVRFAFLCTHKPRAFPTFGDRGDLDAVVVGSVPYPVTWRQAAPVLRSTKWLPS